MKYKGSDKERKVRPVAVDIVIIHDRKIALVKRNHEPFKGEWVLPGGYVEWNETVENAAIREAKEETGLNIELVDLIGIYSDPNRDERHNVSIAFIAFPKDLAKKTKVEKEEIKEVKWFKLENIPKLGFDHEKIVNDAIEFYNSMQCNNCIHCSGCDF